MTLRRRRQLLPAYKGETPTKAEDDKYTYEFIGWKPTIDKMTGDIVYKATEKPSPTPEPAPAATDKAEEKVVVSEKANTVPKLGEDAADSIAFVLAIIGGAPAIGASRKRA